jgi:dUTPase
MGKNVIMLYDRKSEKIGTVDVQEMIPVHLLPTCSDSLKTEIETIVNDAVKYQLRVRSGFANSNGNVETIRIIDKDKPSFVVSLCDAISAHRFADGIRIFGIVKPKE